MITEQITENRWLLYDDPRLLDWCAERIASLENAEAWHKQGAQALGIADGGNILAVMVIHGFQRVYKDCSLSMAADSPNWASRTIIQKLLDYPFNRLGVNRITTHTASKNRRALRFNEGIGFVREGLLRQGCGDDDLVICGLLRGDAIAGGWLIPKGLADDVKIVHTSQSMVVTA